MNALVRFLVVDVLCDFEMDGIIWFVERWIAGAGNEDFYGRSTQPVIWT